MRLSKKEIIRFLKSEIIILEKKNNKLKKQEKQYQEMIRNQKKEGVIIDFQKIIEQQNKLNVLLNDVDLGETVILINELKETNALLTGLLKDNGFEVIT